MTLKAFLLHGKLFLTYKCEIVTLNFSETLRVSNMTNFKMTNQMILTDPILKVTRLIKFTSYDTYLACSIQ